MKTKSVIESRIAVAGMLLLIVASLCNEVKSAAAVDDGKPAVFTLASSAFVDGGKLPAEFTCDGGRASPPLEWSNAPAGTKSFAITMHHIPGPGDTHVYFVVYNIPATTMSLAKNDKNVGMMGINTVNGKQEYTPPCSKGPGAKKYTMTVYALSDEPKLNVRPAAVAMELLLEAIKDKTLAKATMDVTYERSGRAAEGRGGGGPGGRGDEPGQRGGGAGGPPRPGEGGGSMQRAIDELRLSDEQKKKVDPLVQEFRQKQMQEREEFLKKMKEVLDAKQYEQLEQGMRQPPPGRGQGAGRPDRNPA